MLSNHVLFLIHQNIYSKHLIFSTIENEKDNRISFLDLKVIPEQGIFKTPTYHETTLSGIFTLFDCFLPSN